MSVAERFTNIPEIDVQQGLKTVAGNEMIYLRLLGKIEPLLEKSLGNLRSIDFEAVDLQLVSFEAHSIKGAMYNLGIMPIGDIAKELELAAKNGDARSIVEQLPLFIERSEEFSARLKAALQ